MAIFWLNELYRLSHENNIPEAINLLYHKVDDDLCNGRFKECNDYLSQLNLDPVRPELWIALLTITLAAKDSLPYRAELFDQIQTKLLALGEDLTSLAGLQ